MNNIKQQLAELQAFLDENEIKYFTAVDCKGFYNRLSNQIPDKKYWTDMIAILKNLYPLQEFLIDNRIKYFKATELVGFYHRGNTIPKRSLWNNIIPTLKILDKCREVVGRIKINCCYRNEEFNEYADGSSNSRHKYFEACDITPLDTPLKEVALWLNSRIPQDSWGLRLYNTFIHTDCRDWKYREGI